MNPDYNTGFFADLLANYVEDFLKSYGYHFKGINPGTTERVKCFYAVYANSNLGLKVKINFIRTDASDQLGEENFYIQLYFNNKDGFLDSNHYLTSVISVHEDNFFQNYYHPGQTVPEKLGNALTAICQSLQSYMPGFLEGKQWMEYCYPDWR